MWRVVMVVIAVAGCQTPYATMGFTGGVEETPLGNGAFIVHVAVNGYTSRGTAMSYAYRRAGELCRSGYTLIDSAQGGSSGAIVTQYTVQTYEKPDVTLAIQCKRAPVIAAP